MGRSGSINWNSDWLNRLPIIANAKSEIQQEVNKAKENLRAQVASLAIEGAQKILEKEIDAKTHSTMLTKLSKDL